MKMCNPNMTMGTDKVHVVLNVHVCIKVSLESLPYFNDHLLKKWFENPFLLLHHLGHHMGVGYTWKVAAVENQWGSAMVLYWKMMDC